MQVKLGVGLKEAQLVFVKENDSNNYVYYVYGEGYKTVVGITKDYKNVYKIKKIYIVIFYMWMNIIIY